MIVLALRIFMSMVYSNLIMVTGSSTNCLLSGNNEIYSMDSTTTITLESLAQEICPNTSRSRQPPRHSHHIPRKFSITVVQ